MNDNNNYTNSHTMENSKNADENKENVIKRATYRLIEDAFAGKIGPHTFENSSKAGASE
jgi:hypothetical protein